MQVDLARPGKIEVGVLCNKFVEGQRDGDLLHDGEVAVRMEALANEDVQDLRGGHSAGQIGVHPLNPLVRKRSFFVIGACITSVFNEKKALKKGLIHSGSKMLAIYIPGIKECSFLTAAIAFIIKINYT